MSIATTFIQETVVKGFWVKIEIYALYTCNMGEMKKHIRHIRTVNSIRQSYISKWYTSAHVNLLLGQNQNLCFVCLQYE